MTIETRIKTLEKTLGRRHSLLYEKPCLYLLEKDTGETTEQVCARYEAEHNIKILDRDLVVIMTGD